MIRQMPATAVLLLLAGCAHPPILLQHSSTVVCGAFIGDGRRAITGECDGAVRLFDCRTGREILALGSHACTAIAVDASTDGRRGISCSDDGTLRVWDLVKGGQLACLSDPDGAIWSATFAEDERYCLAGNRTGTVRLWDLESGQAVHSWPIHGDRVTVLRKLGGGRVISAGFDQTIRVWEAKTGKLLQTLSGHEGAVMGLSLSPDRTDLLSGGLDGWLCLWDLRDGKLVRRFGKQEGSYLAVAWTRAGCLAGGDHGLSLWNRADGEIINRFEGNDETAWSITLSPDKRHVLVGMSDNTARFLPAP